MTDRLNKIYSVLEDCKTFADIGCDHGYIAKEMIKNGRCDKVIISDISEKSLQKAKDLLFRYIEKGKVCAVVSDGFDFVPDCDSALIAGIGGEEIVSILKRRKNLPEKLFLQPMRNCDKVRVFCTENGYKVKKDFVFKSGIKFYDMICLSKGKDSLTQEEIEFGRSNLKEKSCDFKAMIQEKIDKYLSYSKRENISKSSKEEMLKKVERLKKYV